MRDMREHKVQMRFVLHKEDKGKQESMMGGVSRLSEKNANKRKR